LFPADGVIYFVVAAGYSTTSHGALHSRCGRPVENHRLAAGDTY